MEREQRNGGQRTETDRLASSAANSPAYRVRVSLNELANCSQRCTQRSALPCSSDITIQKEKARYSGQEKERGRKRKRERKRKRKRETQLDHCIPCPLVTFMIRVKQRFSLIRLASVRPFLSVLFPLFCTFFLFFFFSS